MRHLGFVLVGLALVGCEQGSAPHYAQAPEPVMQKAAPGVAQAPSMDSAMLEGTEAAPSRAGGSGGVPRSGASTAPKPAAKPAARMVHYNAYARLKVTSPKETLTEATRIAEAAGGYVEMLTDTTLGLRIPVQKLRPTFAALLKLGDVMARSQTAQDVTDAYTAAELRLATLKASRDRLIALLARSQSEEEKIELLHEIQRLTEEVDQLASQVKTIAALASYSRVTLELVPRQAHTSETTDEVAAFQWIHELSPFRRDVAQQGDALHFPTPDGMVALIDDSRWFGKHWVAESADGAVIWASQRENVPRGSTDFWIETLRTRLGPEYASAEVVTIGTYKFLHLIDQAEMAYRYLVGVHAEDDDLDVVEIYYPSAAHEQRYDAAVRAAIARGES